MFVDKNTICKHNVKRVRLHLAFKNSIFDLKY